MSSLEEPRTAQGEELTDGEKELMRKLFGNWLVLPDSFKASLADYVSQNSLIPVSQVRGFSQTVAKQASIQTAESTTSTSYADLSTVGPTIEDLEPGVYILSYGCECGATPIPAAADSAIMSPSINGTVTAFDADRVVFQSLFSTAQLSASVSRTLRVELTESVNSIVMKYRCINGNGVSFAGRWVVAQRIGNL